MKRIFVTKFDTKCEKKQLFPLVRPFLLSPSEEISGNLSNAQIVSSLADADLVLISEPLRHWQEKNKYKELAEINRACEEKNIKAFAYISGDYGKVHPRFNKIIYYRMGGFKSQLDEKNRAFFPVISDQLKKLLNKDSIVLREKKTKPVVGFCGHASSSILKLIYERLKLAQLNGERLLTGDYNFEPLFSSAYERYQILKRLGRSNKIKTNFILRRKYRAGAVTEEERRKTTIEYYNNIIESDYIVCLRGSGNFSVRLYETLMMGRIPVFINTDCLLPLEEEIDWKRHVVWVEWSERKRIAEKVIDFHDQLANREFIELQKRNREIWLTQFNIGSYLKNLLNTTF